MSRTALVGCSGFVGGTLMRAHQFSDLYRSTNIQEIRGKHYDLLVCAAPSAAKWQANRNPEQDRAAVDQLIDNLAEVKSSECLVISTVDVYPIPRDVDESFDCGSQPNHAYGTNRLYLEHSLSKMFGESRVVRLPGLFGTGLKKNAIYDLLYDNCLTAINPESSFQYYDLSCLWEDLQTIRRSQVRLINLATEPVVTKTILQSYFPDKHVGQQASPEAHYDIHTRHAEIFSKNGPYRFERAEVLTRLGRYIHSVHQSVPPEAGA